MHERLFGEGEPNTGPYAELIELMVEEGMKSLEEHSALKKSQVKGGQSGFGICLGMKNLDIINFELELAQHEKEDRNNKIRLNDGLMSSEDYWHQYYSTLQVRHCYEILRVAYLHENGVLPDDQRDTTSARAHMAYSGLVTRLHFKRAEPS